MINHTSRNTADLENSPLLRSVGEGPCWGQPPGMRFVVHGCHHRAQPASPERCSTHRARPFPGACRDFSLHPISTDGLRTGQTSRHHRGTSAPRANGFNIRHTEQTASNVPKRCPSARKAKPRATNHQPSVPCFFSPLPNPPCLSPWVGVSCRLCTQEPRACTKQQQPPPRCPASGGNWSGITCPPRARRLLLQQTFQAGTPPDGKIAVTLSPAVSSAICSAAAPAASR